MALRTHLASRPPTRDSARRITRPAASSGPGRAPGSDGRIRVRGRGSPPTRPLTDRGRARRRSAVAVNGAAVRRRGEALFLDAAGPAASPQSSPSPSPPPEWGAQEVVEAPPGHPGERVAAGRWERLRLALSERLPVWVQSRCGLEPRTLAALSVVLVVAAGVAGRYFWTGRPEAVRAPEIVRAAPMPEAGASPVVPAAPTSAAPPTGVVVDVSGKVRRPGVLTLPAGSRVADALRAAGGVRPGTDLTHLNRARILMDGEQVAVGVPAAAVVGGGGAGVGTGPGAAAGTRAAPLSLNAATVEQLDTLPGVGPVLAQHIVDHRTEHGGFRSVAELREVNGIGERRFADLSPLVRP
ncbi:helix-hairpin-helix domain-containing protein [Streptomyces sp. NPDC013457]|uniref:helix-hairpin-helix domain-containing protein n=1 Tax=Streptomyces sp. NPDC013457 TaxID=3364866 RepID=UPI0036F8AA67